MARRNFEAFEQAEAAKLEQEGEKEFDISGVKEDKVNPTEDLENSENSAKKSIETVVDVQSYGKDLASTLENIKQAEILANQKNPPLSNEEIEELLEQMY